MFKIKRLITPNADTKQPKVSHIDGGNTKTVQSFWEKAVFINLNMTQQFHP